MLTSRTVLAGGFLALAMLTASACAQLKEAITGRDLECNGVPEVICAGLADHNVRQWGPANVEAHGPIVLVQVRPVECRSAPAMVRCWDVTGSTAALADGSGEAGMGGVYYQNADGIVFDWDNRVIGTFPME